ncbi:MAG: HAMP domain-containing histidine kinase [Cyanothece sp. SIO2G6]|nr:HAMP domain-containing histidine kinase [Cyanothece sp. SIO2G6]
MQVGSEFFHLCHEQLQLLVHGLGASLVIVALTEQPRQHDDLQNLAFAPIVTYPDAFSNIDPQALMMWLAEVWSTELDSTRTAGNGKNGPTCHVPGQVLNEMPWSQQPAPDQVRHMPDDTAVAGASSALEYRSPLRFYQAPVVLPLVYRDMMMGMLVTARVDRGWSQLEQYEMERIAQTLAMTCGLDQRSQWLEQRLHQQTMTYAQLQDHQQERLDDILHQFRNPLTALRTFGKLLIKRLQPVDRNWTVAESIVRESDRLQDLLNQLAETVTMATPILPNSLPPTASAQPSASSSEVIAVSSSKPGENWTTSGLARDTGTPQPVSVDFSQRTVKALTGQTIHLVPTSILDILSPLMVSASAIAQDRQITLQMAAIDAPAPVLVDTKALREVLNNLLDNALKYTPAGGQVMVIPGIARETRLNGSVHQGLAIVDTGPGIPPDDQLHLFERHFRGVQADSDIPGTGLGLAIAQMLMQQMQGNIEVFSPVATCPVPLPLYLKPNSPAADPPSASVPVVSGKSNPMYSGAPGSGTVFIVWMVSGDVG